MWIDATSLKVRAQDRIVWVAVIVAVGVNTDGRREVLGLDIGPCKAETFWTAFLRKRARRGLRGVKLVISDAHEGIKAAVSKGLTASWQRCRVHVTRNALSHAGRSGPRVMVGKPIISRRRSASEVFSTSARRFIMASVIGGLSVQVGCRNPTLPQDRR